LLDDSLKITDMFALNLGFYQTLILVVISTLEYQIHLYKLTCQRYICTHTS